MADKYMQLRNTTANYILVDQNLHIKACKLEEQEAI